MPKRRLRVALAVGLASCWWSWADAAEIRVSPDGSGDAPSIQAAIDVAGSADVIVLADGTFTGAGNRDLALPARNCWIRSESGDAAGCVIDLQGFRGFVQVLPYRLTLENVTLRGGFNDAGGGALRCAGGWTTVRGCRFYWNASLGDHGGAVEIDHVLAGAPSEIIDCEFQGNGSGAGGGSALWFAGDRLTLQGCSFRNHVGPGFVVVQWRGLVEMSGCVFAQNQAAAGAYDADFGALDLTGCVWIRNDAYYYGALTVHACHVQVRESTFVDNGAPYAADINLGYSSGVNIDIERCLFAFARAPYSVMGYPGDPPHISCSDIFTQGAGWHPAIASQLGTNGNLDANPLICDTTGDDLRVADVSPCLPANNSCGVQIGYFAQGCSSDGYIVYPDGHGPLATIQLALDVAPAGAEVLLADGVFTGEGNRDLDFRGKAVTLRSQSGNPAACVIDVAGAGRGFHFHSGEGPAAVVAGLTVRGGPILVEGAAPWFADCRFEAGHAIWGGGLAVTSNGWPVLRRCVFYANQADIGGAISVQGANADLYSCTIAGNRSATGALFVLNGVLRVEQSIVAHNLVGPAATVAGEGELFLATSDLYDNEGGDWTAPIAAQLDLRDNFLAPPCFCALEDGVLTLCEESYCLPAHNPLGNGLLVGALAAGCDGCVCTGPVAVLVSGFAPQAAPGQVSFDFTVAGQGERVPVLVAQQDGIERRVAGVTPLGADRFIACDGHPSLLGGVTLTYRLYADDDLVTILGEATIAVPPLGGPTVAVQPNPFNPTTTVAYTVPAAGPVDLAVFDLRGRRIATLLRTSLAAGAGTVIWDGRDDAGRGVEAGSYLCRLEAGGITRTTAMSLVK